MRGLVPVALAAVSNSRHGHLPSKGPEHDGPRQPAGPREAAPDDALHEPGPLLLGGGAGDRTRRWLLAVGHKRQALLRRDVRPLLHPDRAQLRRRAGRGGRQADGRARVLHQLELRASAGHRAGRQNRRDRAGRPQPHLLLLRRLGGERVDHQAGPPVPPDPRGGPPLQDDRPPHRLPRHDAGRALADRHRLDPEPLRAAAPGRAPRLQHEQLPPPRGRDGGRVHGVPARRAARRDRAGGAGDDLRLLRRAGAELGRHVHAAGGVLPGRPRDL